MPDDETLNQMIARREEEFDLFMVMLQKIMETNALLLCPLVLLMQDVWSMRVLAAFPL